MREYLQSRKIPIFSQATEKFIKELLFYKKPVNCLEIGSAVAYSTIQIAKSILDFGGILYSFEKSYTAYLEGISNIKKQNINNIKLYPFDFNQIKLEDFLPNQLDFVFIDAQKNEYGNYMNKIKPIINNKTVIIIDDVIKFHNKLEGLYKYLDKNQLKYSIYKLDDDDGVMTINYNYSN